MTDENTPASEGAPERVSAISIEDEMRASYLDYAMSVIIGRALPDVRDGLKPVHRRVLFAMHELGNTYQRAYKKSARIVGDVIGKYHPHGDQAVYDTLVRMAQDFSMRHVLVDGQGNFGSIDGDPPAAMRYTEVRMARLASEMLADIEKDTVDHAPNYDESLQEPLVLPAKVPHLLVNGSSGIAVGMATNIPPHNLGEVIDATIALIHNPRLTVLELMRHIPAPDFPTAGLLFGQAGLRQAYETGRGVVQLRGRAVHEEGKRNDRLVITEIPYQVNKTTLIEKIADLVKDKRLEGISDIRDESDREGMRIVIELKRDASFEVVLNHLYANTSLQSSFGINMLAIVEGQPRVLALTEVLHHFIAHRRDVVTRRSRFELREAQKRFNIVFGLLAAIDSIDRVIQIVRQAPDQTVAKERLMSERLQVGAAFKEVCQRVLAYNYQPALDAMKEGWVQLGPEQAQAILDMRLARLTGLEKDKLSTELASLSETIRNLLDILGSNTRLMQVIEEELRAIKATYAEPRRTEVVVDAREISIEDLIANEDMVVTVSHLGYVKRNPVSLYQAQNRGGRGKTAATTREEDFVESIFVASTHSHVLVFTDKGKVYWLKVHEIPQAGRASRGRPLVNMINIEPNERIAAVLPVDQFTEGQYLIMATAQGVIKKTDLMAFANPRPSGIIALIIDEGDSLIRVCQTNGSRDILVATREGFAVRFPEDQVRSMGRSARGVRAISLKREGDAVVGMVVIDENVPHILTLCDNGFGKRTEVSEYRLQSRGGSGIFNSKVTDKTGLVSCVLGVNDQHQIMVVTNRGMMIRVPVSQISLVGRATQGVKVISTEEGESVASVVCIAEPSEEESTQEST
jgi:DNA gyrase subunit A